MSKYSLNADVVAEIVEVVAEHLEVRHLGIEEKEVLTHLVAMSIALYFSKISDVDQASKVH